MGAAKKINKADVNAISISPCGRPAKDHRLMIEAILHRLRVGCPWRDLPQGFGSWSSVYTRWSRWNHSGLWQKILTLLADTGAVGELRHLDATHIKVHQDANACGSQCFQAIGSTKGGRNTKVTALVDGAGRAVQISLAEGQRADVKAAEAIQTPEGKRVVADKGYDSDSLRNRFAAEGATTSIAPKSNRRSKVPFHRGYYRLRHRVENLFQRLKRFRAVGTRYDKSDVHFGGGVYLSAVIDWLKFGV
jgi:transposase